MPRITHYLIPNGISRTVQANPYKPLMNDWFAYIRKEVEEIRMSKEWMRLNKNLPAYQSEDIELFMHWRKWQKINK